MDEQLKQIGERLKGLRDVLDIPVSEMAETIGISTDKYEKIEQGELDITISNLMKIARKYGVSTEELIFAEAPHMKSYYVTRKGQGMSIERTKAYKYQSLVGGHSLLFLIQMYRKKNSILSVYLIKISGNLFFSIFSFWLYVSGLLLCLSKNGFQQEKLLFKAQVRFKVLLNPEKRLLLAI